jgi:hypothetical protein
MNNAHTVKKVDLSKIVYIAIMAVVLFLAF